MEALFVEVGEHKSCPISETCESDAVDHVAQRISDMRTASDEIYVSDGNGNRFKVSGCCDREGILSAIRKIRSVSN